MVVVLCFQGACIHSCSNRRCSSTLKIYIDSVQFVPSKTLKGHLYVTAFLPQNILYNFVYWHSIHIITIYFKKAVVYSEIAGRRRPAFGDRFYEKGLIGTTFKDDPNT